MSLNKYCFIVLAWGLFLAGGPAAADVPPALAGLLGEVLKGHPEVRSAEAALTAAEARARAAGRPLYNPELELDTEQTGVNTTFLGLNQSIDWTDKRGARSDRGAREVAAARAELLLVRQRVAGEFLDALNRYHTGRTAARLAQRRVALLEDFLDLARRRLAAGDVGQSDVDLARLALSEARMAAAGRASDLAGAEAALRAMVSSVPARWPVLPSLPPARIDAAMERLLDAHPRLLRDQARFQAARAGVELARRERRPDPTIGVRGGRDDEDTLLGLTLTVPLFVRNNFRAEVEAAAAEARLNEADYRNSRRRVRAAMEAAAERYRLTRAALADWERSGLPSLQGRVKLLQRLWESGEINTTEYLVQLQQTLDTELAAVELQGSAWVAWLAWLEASGQVTRWLGLAGEPALDNRMPSPAAGGTGETR